MVYLNFQFFQLTTDHLAIGDILPYAFVYLLDIKNLNRGKEGRIGTKVRGKEVYYSRREGKRGEGESQGSLDTSIISQLLEMIVVSHNM